MDRKTIAVLLSAIFILVAGLGVAVYFLYSGVSSGKKEAGVQEIASDSRGGLFLAVPADAVAAMYFDDLKTLVHTLSGEASAAGFFSDGLFGSFLDSLDSRIAAKELPSMKGAGSVLSYHYDGRLSPVLIIDASKSGSTLPEDFYTLRGIAEAAGLFSSSLDCSRLADKGTYLEKRNILVISTSDVLLKSSERHVSQGVSVLDQRGFCEALTSVSGGKGQLYISNDSISRLFTGILNPEYRRYSDFFRRLSSWLAFSFDNVAADHIFMSGTAICSSGDEEFMNAFGKTSAAISSAAEILPSNTVAAFSLPVHDIAESVAAYEKFAETKIGRAKYDAAIDALAKRNGISPLKWAEQIDLKEVAVGSFYVGQSLETVLLLRTGKPDPDLMSSIVGMSSLKTYVPAVHEFPYKGFASALFGSLFSAGDEQAATFIDGWIIAGSQAAVEEYAGGRALESRLSGYAQSAGLGGRIDGRNSHFLAYMSMAEDARVIDRVFRRQYAGNLRSAIGGAAFAPVVLKVSTVKGKNYMSLTFDMAEEVKGNVPEFAQEADVAVPSGPFAVKNSGTGKQNVFSQQEDMHLCLKDENGKVLWNVDFKTPLCGCANTVDYFANGKLQILFASGSHLYLIDRLGRFVKPFPVNLGKDILLGPDVYDFNGTRKYNVMVLHKDNTIDMYNLQGRKPADWKGIACKETITGLPEMLKVSGKTFWAVRTSQQTLIYPFYGGEPLNVSGGSMRIRPDSVLTPVKGGLEATRYDGKNTIIELK